MSKLRTSIIIYLAIIAFASASHAAGFRNTLEPGPYTPGFRMITMADSSRTFLTSGGGPEIPRPVRLYLWYPAERSSRPAMEFGTYLRLATEEGGLPVPLKKGLSEESLKALEAEHTSAVAEAAPSEGRFPLLIMGQGLYYESPLSHFILCEFLASHGYVVATSPLVGTLYRLVNINVEDLETQVRDMEFVLAAAKELPFVNAGQTGVIGYDLGGIAGLVLSMRRPEVRAFLSFDAGILTPHWSGLPNSHPSFRENRFVIPWMHMTQAWFFDTIGQDSTTSTLADKKKFGDTYLVPVPTTNHGQFSSYAMMGIGDAVPGYWGPVAGDVRTIHEAICGLSLDFLNAYLKQDGAAIARIRGEGGGAGNGLPPGGGGSGAADAGLKVEFRAGHPAPPSEAELVTFIIEKGTREAIPLIDSVRAAHPDGILLSEGVLNWLGYHFLLWWGRENEAIEVFELNVSLFPGSSNARDSLGEAYMFIGETEKGIASYRKALELDPNNRAAAEIIRQHEEGKNE